MTGGDAHDGWFPTADDLVAAHEAVVAAEPAVEGGVDDVGSLAYLVGVVAEGGAGPGGATLHERAYELLRLVVAEEPFAAANAATALAGAVALYAMNGHALQYDDEVVRILDDVAADEGAVAADVVCAYLDGHTTPVDRETYLGGTADPDDVLVGRVARQDRERNPEVYDALVDE